MKENVMRDLINELTIVARRHHASGCLKTLINQVVAKHIAKEMPKSLQVAETYKDYSHDPSGYSEDDAGAIILSRVLDSCIAAGDEEAADALRASIAKLQRREYSVMGDAFEGQHDQHAAQPVVSEKDLRKRISSIVHSCNSSQDGEVTDEGTAEIMKAIRPYLRTPESVSLKVLAEFLGGRSSDYQLAVDAAKVWGLKWK